MPAEYFLFEIGAHFCAIVLFMAAPNRPADCGVESEDESKLFFLAVLVMGVWRMDVAVGFWFVIIGGCVSSFKSKSLATVML